MKFNEKVYFYCKKIPRGKVSTYKEIGKAMNSKAYRAIGQALRKNPYAPIVPCHRVVASDGKIGGFGGAVKGKKIKKKILLLKKERVDVKNNKIMNFEKIIYRF